MIKTFFHNIEQVLLAIDQLLNTILCAFFDPGTKVYADESLSAHAWRCREESSFWGLNRCIIDMIFFWQEDHCETAYHSEKEKKQLPPEYRD